MKSALFVLTEDWFFMSHFQPMARAVRSLGLKVIVVARQSAAADSIRALGYDFVPIDIGRSGLNPLGVARSIFALRKILTEYRPSIVHAIALPPVFVAALATTTLPNEHQVILAPTGLGHLWLENDWPTKLAREVVRTVIALSGKRHSTHFLFENAEDPAEFFLNPDDGDKITLVGGAGVSATAFTPTPPPATPPMRVAIVARMTDSKGIAPAVEAVRQLRTTGRDIHLDLYGTPDTSNKRSIPLAKLKEWNSLEGISWHGHAADVREVWAGTHVAVLLSWREGLPRAVVEAMACGKPIVTTDVAGCRTLVRDGIEGLLVPPEDIPATVKALQGLYDNPHHRVAMGEAARQRFENGFTDADVERVTRQVYQFLIESNSVLCKQ